MKKVVIAGVIALIMASLLIAPGCGGNKGPTPSSSPTPSSPPQRATLRQAWFPWSGYAGELEAVQNYARLNGLDLVVEKGADDIDPIKLVVAGGNDFGVGSAEYVVNASQKGADLYIIGVINYQSPTCFIAMEDEKVHSFGDFKGKRVGVLTGTETETVYKLLKLKGIIDPAGVKEVEAPFDLASFITTNSYDIRPAYIYDEPISLDAKGIKYTVIKPDEFVSLISGVYFTTGKMLRESPDKVRAFITSVAQGWEKALKDPEGAIRLLAEYDKGVDAKKELQSLKVGAPYFAGEDGRILWVSAKRLDDFAGAMVDLKEAPSKDDVLKWFDLRFVNEYHQKRGAAK